ncbi:PhzF family phenazine biosynthesis protein [Ottowia sp. GY511]|uniref:PhzF family phenazine biosynthesis protein n=1 Tax=Ottowia flava TaxID=2675430 RepID=A0ABW4KWL8_9BURK|nr:PhzF family phenazine biosynthesis protein [Ottowia sp. GY511]TXK28474.1 PhzF family phenazine biosynthesis protein [Ottowia sp. GY511]
MRNRPFQQIDVFTAAPGYGNPVAVVLDGTGLDDAAMQHFARWTNLSETTFVLPPTDAQADYQLRIFTPGGELPFAGHPTLGSCHAWLAAGGQPKRADVIVQQCAKGLVPIRREAVGGGERLAFAAPPVAMSAPSPAVLAQVAAALGLKAAQIAKAQLLDNGPVWLGLLLHDADAVLALEPQHSVLADLGQKVGVAGVHQAQGATQLISRSNREARAFGAAADAPAIEVRAFAAPIGVNEDPVTGSLNASLAQWLIGTGDLPAQYVAAQGTALGRAGRVHIAQAGDGQVWVGGDCVGVVRGEVTL